MWLAVLFIMFCISMAVYSSKLRREKKIQEEEQSAQYRSDHATQVTTNSTEHRTHHSIEQSESLVNQSFDIHDDLRDLLWIKNGPHKNYEIRQTPQSTSAIGGNIVLSSIDKEEPSLIDVTLPVRLVDDISQVPRPPYSPSYAQLTLEQRGVYLKLLQNPYNPAIDIGYVFVLYYGLERHLVEGNLDRAFDVLLKLRDVYDNDSFQSISVKALLHACSIHQRRDLLEKLAYSVDKEGYGQKLDIFSFIILKNIRQENIYANELMIYARSFGFENHRYIKMHPQAFEKCLKNHLEEHYGEPALPLSLVDVSAMELESNVVFYNASFEERTVLLPKISSCEEFRVAAYDALHSAHKAVKNLGLSVPKSTTPRKLIPVVEYDKPNIAAYDHLSANDKYSQALNEMDSIKKTGMTKTGFIAYVTYGEIALSCLAEVTKELLDLAKKHNWDDDGIPPVIHPRDYLPDMYMRWGQWEDAKRVFTKCREAGVLSDADCDRLIKECNGKMVTVDRVAQILNDNPSPMKQTELKKRLGNFEPNSLNWVLRFYEGFSRVKEGSSYLVSRIDF